MDQTEADALALERANIIQEMAELDRQIANNKARIARAQKEAWDKDKYHPDYRRWQVKAVEMAARKQALQARSGTIKTVMRANGCPSHLESFIHVARELLSPELFAALEAAARQDAMRVKSRTKPRE